MLILIGLGLDLKDISVRALEAVKKADIVYLEEYTTLVSEEYKKYLKAEPKNGITIIGRSQLEEDAKKTLEPAKTKDLAILIPGDPLIATTHYSTLLNIASDMKIKTKVYHSTSILSASIGESGLDAYKFGPIVTIAHWSKNYKPTSFLDTIRKNLENSEHSLILLDLKPDLGHMSLEEAITLLKSAEKEKKYDIINDDLKILVMGNIGREDQEIAYTYIKKINDISPRFKNMTLSIIVPSVPSFAEQESLNKFRQN